MFVEMRSLVLDWQLSVKELSAITKISEERLSAFLAGKVVPEKGQAEGGTIAAGYEALVPLIAIWKKLKQRYKKQEDCIKWLTTELPDFENRKPITVMAMTPEHMAWVAYYLDSLLTNQS